MTSKPHDGLFKAVFQQPAQAVGELQHLLPADLVAAIDWSSLELQPGSYVDEELADLHSDLLFSAHTSGSREPVLLYVIFEHQSSHEHRMSLRLLRYMVRIWTRFASDNKDGPLPLILPALLAQVPGGRRAPTHFRELFSPSLATLGRAALPDFSYVVDDLHNADDDNLRKRALAHQGRLALWLLRDARDGALLLERLANWADELEALAHTPGGPDALALLVRYVATAADGLHLSQFHDILRGRAPAAESVTMTIAEQLRAEGRLEGRREGRREGQSEGRREGALHGAATSLLTVLETRGIVVPAGARSRIEACQELDVLQHWLVRATTVTTADEIFDT